MNGMMGPGGSGMEPGGEAGGAGPGAQGGSGSGGVAPAAGSTAAAIAKAKAESSNKFKRVAGGKSWEDETLAEWPDSEWCVFLR